MSLIQTDNVKHQTIKAAGWGLKTRAGLLFFVGFASTIIQVVMVRNLLAVFSGNELTIGLTLSFWLLAFGAGSAAGSRLFTHPEALPCSFVAAGLVVQPMIILVRAAGPLAGVGAGEVMPLAATLIFIAAGVFPVAFILGLQFPLSVRFLAVDRLKAHHVYSTEAAGAVLGGLAFVFLFSTRVQSLLLVTLTSAAYILLSIPMGRSKIFLRATAALVPVVVYIFLGTRIGALPWRDFHVARAAESRYGELVLTETADQANLYLSDQFMYSYPDLQTEESVAHVPMTLQLNPQNVLFVSGSPGVVREMLKYPSSNIDFLEEDESVLRVLKYKLTPEDEAALADDRTKVLLRDSRQYLRSLRSPVYDLILVGISDPATASINRFFTTGFFRLAEGALKEGGILVISGVRSSGYTSLSGRLVNGSIFRSLKKVFKYAEPGSRESGLFFASNSPLELDPRNLEERFRNRNIPVSIFSPYLFHDITNETERKDIRAGLSGVEVENRDMKPITYLFSLIHWLNIQGISPMLSSRLAVLLSLLIGVLAFIGIYYSWRSRPGAVYFVIASTGFSGMAVSAAVLLAFQGIYGYVYEYMGILTAVFMAGAAAGASLKGMRSSSPYLWLNILDGAFLILLLAAPIIADTGTALYLINICAGFLTGHQFKTANLALSRITDPVTAGRLYGIDLAGSSLGVLIASLLFIPLAGIGNTFLLLACLKAVSLTSGTLGLLRQRRTSMSTA